MPSWREVAEEVSCQSSPITLVRRKYLAIMSKYTGRNIISYYSSFLQKTETQKSGIDDNDKNAFMQAVYGLDKSKGVDLVLHTPGGSIAATESLVIYLKKIFKNDIRVFVPQIAMSAGTMVALSAKEIVMGKQSNLGPIDPQFGGMSCAGILEEFSKAVEDIKNNPSSRELWQMIIGKYHPTFLGDCKKAMDWSEKMVKEWLLENMFLEDGDKEEKVERIVSILSSHNETYSHQRHIHADELINLGLKIKMLEDLDNRTIDGCKDMQDCVLTLHHAYMQTMANSNVIKIIENQNGVGLMLTVAVKNSLRGRG